MTGGARRSPVPGAGWSAGILKDHGPPADSRPMNHVSQGNP